MENQNINDQNNYFFEPDDFIQNTKKQTCYIVKEFIGEGAFSQVYMAELIQNQQNNQFENESQIDLAITSENLKNKDENQNFYALKIIDKKKPQYKHRAQKEIEILNKLNNANKDQNDSSYNIVKIFDHFEFENYLIIVQELMETSLSDLLICLQFQGFNFFQIAKWTKQLLKAIQFLQNQNIIHADIKPSNILFKNDKAYLSDFGSAFYISQQENIYPYFQSRFYRAPEVILEINQFKQIDLWSLACVTAEMYLGFPLFHGKNTHDQIIQIVTILKDQNLEILKKGKQFNNYFEISNNSQINVKINPIVNENESILSFLDDKTQNQNNQKQKLLSIPQIQSIKDLYTYLPSSPLRLPFEIEILENEYIYFIEYLTKCLKIDLNLRCTVQEALEDPFINYFNNVDKITYETKQTNDQVEN